MLGWGVNLHILALKLKFTKPFLDNFSGFLILLLWASDHHLLWRPVTGQVIRPPNFSPDAIPETSFTCEDKITGGYYADAEASCQLFHVCVQVSEYEVSVWFSHFSLCKTSMQGFFKTVMNRACIKLLDTLIRKGAGFKYPRDQLAVVCTIINTNYIEIAEMITIKRRRRLIPLKNRFVFSCFIVISFEKNWHWTDNDKIQIPRWSTCSCNSSQVSSCLCVNFWKNF